MVSIGNTRLEKEFYDDMKKWIDEVLMPVKERAKDIGVDFVYEAIASGSDDGDTLLLAMFAEVNGAVYEAYAPFSVKGDSENAKAVKGVIDSFGKYLMGAVEIGEKSAFVHNMIYLSVATDISITDVSVYFFGLAYFLRDVANDLPHEYSSGAAAVREVVENLITKFSPSSRGNFPIWVNGKLFGSGDDSGLLN